MQPYIWLLIPIGFFTGFYGTLVGIGGGFILVPTLLFLYPDRGPELITSISLAVVFVNGLSGSLAYARMKRIDYRSGILFALAAMPGATIGALLTGLVPRTLFELVFGLAMAAASLFLFLKPPVSRRKDIDGMAEDDMSPPSYNLAFGIGTSIFVGFLTGFFGIGGGIVHMPVMLYVLHFPVHAATATSHFILAISAFTATFVHITTGTLHEAVVETVLLSIGVVFGAQVGAHVSSRLHGVWIVRGLAIALGIVGLRLVVGVLL